MQSDGTGLRTQETVAPLARALKLPLSTAEAFDADSSVAAISGWNRASPHHGGTGTGSPTGSASGWIDPALADPDKSPRELAWQMTDRTGHFISESSVYRILKAHDLITSPAYVLVRAADRFEHPTRKPNELWQTDFTYLRVVGWGWYYLVHGA